MTVSLDDIQHLAETHLLPAGLRLLVALVVFFAGRSIAKAVMRMLDRVMERSSVDVSLRKFLADVVYAVLLVAVVIVSLDTAGIKTTAVLAVLGAAGLAIGLALQGSLSNFAAGVMLIVLRPYKVGDVVVLGKHLGRVDAIRVFHTVVVTADHREVTIPNGQIVAAPIENLTVLGRRRVDFVITVPDAAHVPEVKHILEGVAHADARVASSPPPAIDIAEITESGVKMYFRPWTATEHYEQLATDAMNQIMQARASAQVKFSVALQMSAA
jgi:small conductance mechanosensitive channel